MAIRQFIVRDVGGRLGVHLPQRPTTAPTVTLYSTSGSVQGTVDAVASTLDSVSTTCNGAVAQGATSIVLTSGTSVVHGADYELGALTPSTATEPIETVRVASVSGTTATLARPTLYAHATLTPFASTLATYDVSAANAAALFGKGWMEFSWTDRESLAQVTVISVECIRKQFDVYGRRRFPHAALCEQDMFEMDPRWNYAAVAEQDLRAWFRWCEQQVLAHLEMHFRARTVLGADLLNYLARHYAHVEQWRMNNETADPDTNPWERRYRDAFERAISIGAADEDQDGVVESHEGPRRSIRISRAS